MSYSCRVFLCNSILDWCDGHDHGCRIHACGVYFSFFSFFKSYSSTSHTLSHTICCTQCSLSNSLIFALFITPFCGFIVGKARAIYSVINTASCSKSTFMCLGAWSLENSVQPCKKPWKKLLFHHKYYNGNPLFDRCFAECSAVSFSNSGRRCDWFHGVLKGDWDHCCGDVLCRWWKFDNVGNCFS